MSWASSETLSLQNSKSKYKLNSRDRGFMRRGWQRTWTGLWSGFPPPARRCGRGGTRPQSWRRTPNHSLKWEKVKTFWGSILPLIWREKPRKPGMRDKRPWRGEGGRTSSTTSSSPTSSELSICWCRLKALIICCAMIITSVTVVHYLSHWAHQVLSELLSDNYTRRFASGSRFHPLYGVPIITKKKKLFLLLQSWEGGEEGQGLWNPLPGEGRCWSWKSSCLCGALEPLWSTGLRCDWFSCS